MTSLAKDFLKQDWMLLVKCHSLTSQLVNCQTSHFVQQARANVAQFAHHAKHGLLS